MKKDNVQIYNSLHGSSIIQFSILDVYNIMLCARVPSMYNLKRPKIKGYTIIVSDFKRTDSGL